MISITNSDETTYLDALQRMQVAIETAKTDGRVLAFAAASQTGAVREIYADGEVRGFEAHAVFNRIPHLVYGQLTAKETPAEAGGSSETGE